jgi:hypothetical protein
VTVAGRECGACFECCRFIPIRSKTLEKPTNEICPNCSSGNGCTRYDNRPGACRGWECGWKLLSSIPEDWRPDRSGIVFRLDAELGDRVSATVAILDSDKVFFTEEFAALIASWVTGGFEVNFQAVGPAGHYPSLLRINKHIAAAFYARDLEAALKMFRRMYDAVSKDYDWQKDGIVLRNDVPTQPLASR